MNFKNLLFTCVLMLSGLVAFAQPCTICTVDENAHATTGPEDFGLIPTSVSVFQGQDTSIVLQYLMPQQLSVSGIGTATVTGVTILGVSGLPLGMDWTSDQFPTNSYNPQTYRYGCVTLCGETFAAPGVYPITVTVNGCGTLSGITQCQNENIDLQLTVLPSASGNALFGFAPGEACDSAVVDFSANITTPNPNINPVIYDWDFGDGNTASGMDVSNNYVGAGEYIVTHTTTIQELFVSEVHAQTQGSWWYQEAVDDGFWLFGTFIELSAADLSGSVTNGGNGIGLGTIDNDASPDWTGLDLVITDPSLALSFQDEETFTNPDLGGVATLTINGPGTFGFSCVQGGQTRVTGTIVIGVRTQSTQTITDTVRIYSQSATPIITNTTGADTICLGDTAILSSSMAGSYQWYLDGTLLPNETGQTIQAAVSGEYAVEVIDMNNICVSEQASVVIEVIDLPAPVINGTNQELFIDNPEGYTTQWFSNGVPIPGANTDSLTDLSSGGPFVVTITNAIGCEASSAAFEICLPGTSASAETAITLSNSATFTSSGFVLNSGNDIAWAVGANAITDMTGLQAAIDAGLVFPSDSVGQVTLDCNDFDLENGDYFITPISVAAFEPDSLLYNPDVDSGCIPDAEICIEITGSDWLILASSLEFTFPNGQSVGVLDALVPPEFSDVIPDTIQPSLLDLLPTVLPNGLCFQLFDLYQGDPNGTWTISATNVGTGVLNIDIPAFVSTVYADSCPLITTDQVINIPASSGSVAGGTTNEFSFSLPPIPEDFPTINTDCNVFGAATAFALNCGTGIDEVLNVSTLNLYPNPNNGLFTVAFELYEMQEVSIQIFDVTGRMIMNRGYGNMNGTFKETIDLKNNLSSGFYVLNLVINNQQVQKHFIVD